MKLEYARDHRLYLCKQSESQPVSIKRCFPWSQEIGFLSLRDENDEEVGFIETLDELEEPSRKAVVKALKLSNFCFVVTQLISVEEDFELRNWRVLTEQGERQFQTKISDWPREEGKSLIIQDIGGDIYFIKSVEALPEPGKSILWAFLD